MLMHSYVTTLDNSSLYTAREEFLHKVCQDIDDNEKLCWTKSVGDFFIEVMYPNIFTKLLCLDCDTMIYQYLNRVKLLLEELISDDLSNLIYKKLEIDSMIPCEACKQQLILFEFEIKHLLCIDIEDNIINTDNCLINLDDLKITITINKYVLTLTGLVEFEEPIGKKRFRHYIAYCSNFNGVWYKYDNTSTSNKPIKIKTKNKSINAAIAIYAVYENNTVSANIPDPLYRYVCNLHTYIIQLVFYN